MKVITLYQPHAILMVLGEKQIETRSRKWNYNGVIAIHAGLSKKWLYMCELEPFKTVLTKYDINIHNMPLGAILGSVDKLSCERTEDLRDNLSPQELAFGNYADNRFGYKTNHPIKYMEPYYILGSQGVWEWNEQRC